MHVRIAMTLVSFFENAFRRSSFLMALWMLSSLYSASAARVPFVLGLYEPHGIAITPTGGELYVVEYTGKRVWHVNLATNAKTEIRTLNSGAHGCALGNGGVLFVAEGTVNLVSKVELTSPYAYSTAVSGLSGPVSVVLNEPKTVMYVAEFSADQVRRVFLNTGNTESSKEVAVSGITSAEGLALSKDGSVLYVGQLVASGSVWRVPLSASGTVVATDSMKIASGLNWPRGLLLSADDTLLYVAETNGGKVHRYELVSGSYASVTLQSGMSRPYGLALTPGEEKLIVSEYSAGTVSYLSPLPAYPFAYTECNATQYESRAPTPSSDRGCSALTVCAPSEAEAVAPTLTSDRRCTEEVAIVDSDLNVPVGIAITPTAPTGGRVLFEDCYEVPSPTPIDVVAHSPTPSIVMIAASSNGDGKNADAAWLS